MFLIGCSYIPEDILNEQDAPESTGFDASELDEKVATQNKNRKTAIMHATRTFKEEILPKLE